jgi:6-pyruvoyltetrahydropterin/6-carboxytetrahydropterin synthase
MEFYSSRTGQFILKLTQTFYFESAHTLEGRYVNVHDKINSQNIHGHTYHASISYDGDVKENGMVKDFGHIKWAVDAIVAKLDHKFLNNVDGLGIPTLENICLFIANQLQKSDSSLCEVTVERKASGDKCTYQLKKAIEK